VTNAEIAAVFLEMSELLRIKGGDWYRARAFAQTARVLTSLRRPALEMGPALLKQKGIGPGSVERMRSIARTGSCADHRRLLNEIPRGLRELLALKGLGPATVRRLHVELGVGCLEHLEVLVAAGQLERTPSFGPRLAQKLAKEIARHRRADVRVGLREAARIGEQLVVELAGHPDALRVELAGSVRRRKPSIRDLDVLVAAANAPAVAEAFKRLEQVEEVILDGQRRASVRLRGGLQADLRLVGVESFGAGLHYFTGSKMHNIAIRVRANRRKLAVTEHGVFHRTTRRRPKNRHHHEVFPRMLPGAREADIFGAVGLPFIPPELREDEGEIEAAEAGRLPRLIEAGDLVGALLLGEAHDAVPRARARGGAWAVLAPRASRFSSASAARAWLAETRARSGTPQLLAGLSARLQKGGLDASKKLLRESDLVVAEVPAARTVAEILRVLDHDLADALILEDPELEAPEVLRACAARGVALVNTGAGRAGRVWRQALELGVPVLLAGPDDDDPTYAVFEARRGWLRPGDVLNAQPLDALNTLRARRRAVAAAPPPDAALSRALRPPLDDETRERVRVFLERGDDPPLAAALAARAGPGQSALQLAFELWAQSETS
jgi:DNA polymerase (family 10)